MYSINENGYIVLHDLNIIIIMQSDFQMHHIIKLLLTQHNQTCIELVIWYRNLNNLRKIKIIIL